MCKDLRKVFYRRAKYPGYAEGRTPEEEATLIEDAKVREGYLHCWTQEEDTSGDVPVAKAKALVEDAEDSILRVIEYDNLAFKEGVL